MKKDNRNYKYRIKIKKVKTFKRHVFTNYLAPYFFILFLFLIQTTTSCTQNFEQYNQDDTAYPEDLQKQDNFWYAIPLMNLQKGIYFNYDWGSGKNWPFQIMQNLNIDLFAGYFHNTNFSANVINSNYDLNTNWNSSLWENTYWYVVPEGRNSEERNKDVIPEFYAITKILKVTVLHRVSDAYGPIMYRDFGDVKSGCVPDSQQEAYYEFFNDLDEAIEVLNDSSTIDADKFARFDILMSSGKKHTEQWVKFANSLRLRLAMRISKADPEKAKEEVQKALNSGDIGLLEGLEDIVAVSTFYSGYTNPLGEVNKSWGEVYMNANMESILKGYRDPRLQKYFEPATGENVQKRYKGVRQGIGNAAVYAKYGGHSRSTITQNTDAPLMTAAEVWFLRAEAALRGWSNEDAESCYKSGIRLSFSQWKTDGVEQYLNTNTLPIDYVDAFDASNNIEAVSKISPKWDNEASKEENLERIITQKWIACYPEGCEAWAEQRRTGYPRLFPVKTNMSDGMVDTETMIRRMRFPVSVKTGNIEQYQSLCEKLNGDDSAGTRLWWDKDVANFPD